MGESYEDKKDDEMIKRDNKEKKIREEVHEKEKKMKVIRKGKK